MTVGLDPTSTFSSYQFAEHPFRRPAELDAAEVPTYPVVIVGAGLAGMTLALDLGLRGVPVVVLDRDASVGAAGIASRGIAYSKRSLEILDRLGIAERIRAKAVTWNEGRIHHGLDEILHFTIQPEPNQKDPAFRNLQQFYVEQYLTEAAAEVDPVDLRWHSRVSHVDPGEDVVTVTVETPVGAYRLRARWLVCCEGAGSATRKALGLDPPVVMFEDYWAIVDVRADLGHVQRKFWLDSPLLEGGAQIMHGMADGCVRTDWQISQFPDPEIEITPARVDERLRTMLGPDVEFEVVSISRWRFRRRIMERFVHGRLLFAGDAAHEIPPYGARGWFPGRVVVVTEPSHEHVVVSQLPAVQATPTSHSSPAPSSRIPSRHRDRFAVNRVLDVFFAFTVPVTTSQAASNAPVTRTLPLTPAHATPTLNFECPLATFTLTGAEHAPTSCSAPSLMAMARTAIALPTAMGAS